MTRWGNPHAATKPLWRISRGILRDDDKTRQAGKMGNSKVTGAVVKMLNSCKCTGILSMIYKLYLKH